jgi:tryptophan synthase alpha chain
MRALVAGGADIIELGVPFSDPMADGPTIQRASERALAHGMSLRRVLAMVREFRRENAATPVVLMGYANPVEAYGIDAFARDAHEAGVDGVLVVDYPPEECAGFAAAMKRAGSIRSSCWRRHPPRSASARWRSSAAGYIYYVSLKGVTGSATLDLDEVAARIPLIRAQGRHAGRRRFRHS